MAGEFEWDPNKASSNADKHGVTFFEAASVFTDPRAVTYSDPDHSEWESRELTIGRAKSLVILMVSHTDRSGNVRIISARPATVKERQLYEST